MYYIIYMRQEEIHHTVNSGDLYGGMGGYVHMYFSGEGIYSFYQILKGVYDAKQIKGFHQNDIKVLWKC